MCEASIMKLYFVRHGETTYNANKIYQPANSELSEEGQRQAKFLAKRFINIHIGAVFSSDYTRAVQTAEIINRTLKREVIYSDLLREFRRPSVVVEKSGADADIMEIKRQIGEHIHDPHWHHSDEENFFDIKKRVEKFLALAALRQEEHILIVTHGVFIRFVVSLLIFEDALTPDLFLRFRDAVHLKNTGITLCERSEQGKWELITWNDHAHLG